MSLVSVHLGFAQAVNGVGIGFAAPRVEGQQPYGKQAHDIAQTGIAIVHREGGEHRAADNRADGIAEVEGHLHGCAAMSSPPPWPASVISNCCGAEVKNNPTAIQNVSTASSADCPE